jgi:L,D-transpeptidase ErfK/SrfK
VATPIPILLEFSNPLLINVLEKISRTVQSAMISVCVLFIASTSLVAKDFIGETWNYRISGKDTFIQIAQATDVGYVELVAANPGVDPWIPEKGSKIVIPTQHILPQIRKAGLVINLGDMRLYYFDDELEAKGSWPIGIGRKGHETRLGSTYVSELRIKPSWYPTKEMRRKNPELPNVVLPGPDNPLGNFAIRIGWEGYAIHGTNRPSGIGRRVSSGCIRLYNDDIEEVFSISQLGMKVEIIDEPIKLGWINGVLYLEVHPDEYESDQIEAHSRLERSLFQTTTIRRQIESFAGPKYSKLVNWQAVDIIIQEKRGTPSRITR